MSTRASSSLSSAALNAAPATKSSARQLENGHGRERPHRGGAGGAAQDRGLAEGLAGAHPVDHVFADHRPAVEALADLDLALLDHVEVRGRLALFDDAGAGVVLLLDELRREVLGQTEVETTERALDVAARLTPEHLDRVQRLVGRPSLVDEGRTDVGEDQQRQRRDPGEHDQRDQHVEWRGRQVDDVNVEPEHHTRTVTRSALYRRGLASRSTRFRPVPVPRVVSRPSGGWRRVSDQVEEVGRRGPHRFARRSDRRLRRPVPPSADRRRGQPDPVLHHPARHRHVRVLRRSRDRLRAAQAQCLGEEEAAGRHDAVDPFAPVPADPGVGGGVRARDRGAVPAAPLFRKGPARPRRARVDRRRRPAPPDRRPEGRAQRQRRHLEAVDGAAA